MDKREESKSLVKALGNKMERLQKERQSKLLKMKSVIKAMKDGNAKGWKCPTIKNSTGGFNSNG